MNQRRLRTTLQRIVALSLTSAAACGGVDTGGFEAVPCAAGERVDYLAGLTLADPADYLELHEFEFEPSTARLLQSAGVKCGAATDKAACEAAIAAAATNAMAGFELGQCVQVCTNGYLIVNRGDDVSVVSTKEDMLALLAPIDAAADAVFATELDGYRVQCGDVERGGVKKVGSTFEVIATRITSGCNPVEKTQYRLGVDEKGAITELESSVVESDSGSCIGRRPAALRPCRVTGPSPLGAYWARIAHLEAASIPAFATLHRELAHYGAPPSLLRAAQRAMRDEARHALSTRRLARRFGGAVPRASVDKRPVRSLEAIALENVVEGCVRETFGALVGGAQAERARDGEVRTLMRGLARDERRHASLAWAVDAWIRRRLSAESLARVDEARAQAVSALLDEVQREPHADLVREAGVPDAALATELARRFVQELLPA